MRGCALLLSIIFFPISVSAGEAMGKGQDIGRKEVVIVANDESKVIINNYYLRPYGWKRIDRELKEIKNSMEYFLSLEGDQKKTDKLQDDGIRALQLESENLQALLGGLIKAGSFGLDRYGDEATYEAVQDLISHSEKGREDDLPRKALSALRNGDAGLAADYYGKRAEIYHGNAQKSNALYVDALKKKAVFMFLSRKKEGAVETLISAISVSPADRDLYGIGGIFCMRYGDYDCALKFFLGLRSQLISNFELSENSSLRAEISHVTSFIATIYESRGEFDRAMSSHEDALSYSSGLDLNDYEYDWRASLFFVHGNYFSFLMRRGIGGAEKHYSIIENLILSVKNNNQNEVMFSIEKAGILRLIALHKMRNKDYDGSILILRNAFESYDSVCKKNYYCEKNPFLNGGLFDIIDSLAWVYYNKKDYDSSYELARGYFERSRLLSESFQDDVFFIRHNAKSLYRMAKAVTHRRAYNGAIFCYEQSSRFFLKSFEISKDLQDKGMVDAIRWEIEWVGELKKILPRLGSVYDRVVPRIDDYLNEDEKAILACGGRLTQSR